MDIYEFAMKMEKDGENYYRELAKKTESPGFKNIFIMLADAEVIHQNIFEKMKENEQVKVAPTKILAQVKNIFTQMREEDSEIPIAITQTELYKKAQEIEKNSRDFYLEKAGEVKEPHQKDIFLKIAEEEKKHYLILAEIIDFVSRPQSWLENPEWYHLEDY
ncbi:MAG: ferritin family protein [Thermodesulfovibrionales bacterium]